MNDGSYDIWTFARKDIVTLLICIAFMAMGSKQAYAGLLEGVLEPVTERLAEKAGEKGEKLTTGNFYAPEQPDAHGPIGMMGNHTHNKGEIMWTYRYMLMKMDGIRNGIDGVSTSEVINNGFGFGITPTEMTTQMHMFSGMYGVNNTLTLMLGAPYVIKTMDHTVGNNAPPPVRGTNFQTNSEGWGDIMLTSLWRLYAFEAPSLGSHAFHFNFGITFPTGSITKRDATPTGNNRLPYPMQIGTGTVNILPGLTYRGASDKLSWGAQAAGNVRTGRNDEGWRMGHVYNLTGFGAYRWANWISTSLRANWKYWGNNKGIDNQISQTLPNGAKSVPTAFPEFLGGQRLDILAGINILLPEWKGLENRLAVEAGAPIYQYLNGPQLETDYAVFAGYQGVY